MERLVYSHYDPEVFTMAIGSIPLSANMYHMYWAQDPDNVVITNGDLRGCVHRVLTPKCLDKIPDDALINLEITNDGTQSDISHIVQESVTSLITRQYKLVEADIIWGVARPHEKDYYRPLGNITFADGHSHNDMLDNEKGMPYERGIWINADNMSQRKTLKVQNWWQQVENELSKKNDANLQQSLQGVANQERA